MKSFLRIFFGLFLPIALVLFWVYAYNYDTMLSSATAELQQEMKNMWVLAAQLDHDTEFHTRHHLKIREISRNTSLRITLIRPDGVVVDDSYLDEAGIQAMENHGKRPEVLAAIVEGDGFSERYSTTVKQDMMYYARTLPGGMILRIAYPMTYVSFMKDQWRSQVIRTFIFLLITVALIALLLARRFNRPLMALDRVADQIENRADVIHFPTFRNPIMNRISNLLYRVYASMQQNQRNYQEEKEKLNQILTTLDEAILFLDPKNHVIHANPGVPAMLDFQPKPGSPILDQITDPETLVLLRTILQSDKTHFPRVTWKHRFLDISIRTVDDNRLIVLVDITDRGRYDAYKSELVGNITHELKTPMTSILGYAETLAANPDMPAEQRHRFIDIILNHTRRMNNLIEDILELHRLEADANNSTPLEPTRWDQLSDELTARYHDARQSLSLDLPAGTTAIRYEHLFSLCTNLVDNAMKYSTGSRVSLTASLSGTELTLSVADEGPVIPPSERGRIFERFYTRSRSRNRARAGTGLGLAIVKHIARLYNGNVTVQPNDAGGNTFVVQLIVQERT